MGEWIDVWSDAEIRAVCSCGACLRSGCGCVALWDAAFGRDSACEGAKGGAGVGDGAARWGDVEVVGASRAGGVGELLGDVVWALLGGDAGVDSAVAGVGTEGVSCGWGCD